MISLKLHGDCSPRTQQTRKVAEYLLFLWAWWALMTIPSLANSDTQPHQPPPANRNYQRTKLARLARAVSCIIWYYDTPAAASSVSQTKLYIFFGVIHRIFAAPSRC